MQLGCMNKAVTDWLKLINLSITDIWLLNPYFKEQHDWRPYLAEVERWQSRYEIVWLLINYTHARKQRNEEVQINQKLISHYVANILRKHNWSFPGNHNLEANYLLSTPVHVLHLKFEMLSLLWWTAINRVSTTARSDWLLECEGWNINSINDGNWGDYMSKKTRPST